MRVKEGPECPEVQVSDKWSWEALSVIRDSLTHDDAQYCSDEIIKVYFLCKSLSMKGQWHTQQLWPKI